MTKSSVKFKFIVALSFLLLLGGTSLLLLSGGNQEILSNLFSGEVSADVIREKLSGLGIRGYITVVILSMLQVIFVFLPAEPVQVLSGMAFGFPIAFLLCVIGIIVGNTLIFLMYRALGQKLREYFVTNLDFDFDRAASSPKTAAIIFILYLLPAIPYGMICFLAASVGMKYYRFITVTVLGSVPSVCIGVALGHMALATSFIISITVFAVLVALIFFMIIKRKALFDAVNAYVDKTSKRPKNLVKKYRPWKLVLPLIAMKLLFFVKGAKIKYTNKIGGKLETPSIVLCNHGSFIDFVYAGTMIRKQCPNFVVARLYFYKSFVKRVLRHVGCFPKSMFAQDLESAKNCLAVLKHGGILAMMPEARLSTAGKFEDIQPCTFDFIKRSEVTVYTVKISGDYLASPKWGSGLRRGAVVEAELDVLITKDELAELSTDEIAQRVTDKLYYDEFEWIKSHPEVRYGNKDLAEGLENILTICPKCKSKYTIKTKGHDVFCEHCGKLATMDDRYLFDTGAPFEHFGEWYEWQKAEIEDEFSRNPEYALCSEVEFRLPSLDGKRMLRHAGDGVCTLDKSGLTYKGTKDGEETEIFISMDKIYRLLFGAGENFEVYVGADIHYFKPKEPRSCVDWYIASAVLSDEYHKEKSAAHAH
ncbi:MAG: VTT domain-containing protein [Clostridia bacterium]|nr:VTT domain-containing protein [Clostridia bacterium]